MIPPRIASHVTIELYLNGRPHYSVTANKHHYYRAMQGVYRLIANTSDEWQLYFHYQSSMNNVAAKPYSYPVKDVAKWAHKKPSQNDINFIIENINIMKRSDIANTLDLTYWQVRWIAQHLKLIR